MLRLMIFLNARSRHSSFHHSHIIFHKINFCSLVIIGIMEKSATLVPQPKPTKKTLLGTHIKAHHGLNPKLLRPDMEPLTHDEAPLH
jgi:hypothetical protein